jgi:CheY-like chemotaxis protein
VKQILSFSRESGADLKPVDIVPVVKESLKLMRAVMPATIEFVQVIDTDDSRIMADPTDIHQIIMNLCTNASHAMTEGGRLSVSLKRFEADSSFVSAHPEFSPGSYLRLSVEDTGHGIPEDIIENIFEPYFTTKKKGQGTGLGLAIVHGIVRRMNGHINVYSEPGRGTVFHIYMPVAHAREETDDLWRDEDNHRLPHGGERIMFIDDELHIVETAKMVLEGIGYSVSTFIDPVDALTKFREDPSAYDIVITDMTMPGMTGDGFALELMQLRPDLPVILCTGFSERMNMEKAGEMGIREYLMKPVNPRDLADAIRKALGRRERKQ